jgi:hypothetical protein
LLQSIGTGVEDKATLQSDLSAKSAPYSISAVTSVLPAGYDYAGAHNAINPSVCGCFCAVTICFCQGQSLNSPRLGRTKCLLKGGLGGIVVPPVSIKNAVKNCL